MPKRDSERRSFKSDKAAKVRYLLGVGSLEQAQLLAEQALAEDEDSADTHSLVASILTSAANGRHRLLICAAHTN